MTPETSWGFSAAEFSEHVLGIKLLPWQRWLLIHAFELRDDGKLRFRTVVLLVGRQNGKSTVLQILALWTMYVLGRRLVIGTAQSLDVAEEVWQGAVEMAEDTPDLAAEIDHVSRVNGKKFLRLVSGERYKVAAASRRGGRGLSGDLVMLDELREHQSWDAWAAVTKTTMAREWAQVWAASNAGDASSIVLRHLRRMGHLALGDPDNLSDALDVEPDVDVELDDLAVFEWSAPPGCDLDDPDGWCWANPALGHLIGERAVASAARTDPEWVFRTEVLCQWQEGTDDGPFPSGAWNTCLDEGSEIADGSDVAFCVDVSWDRSTAHVAAAGFREDGRPHVEVIASRAGTDWVVDWLAERRYGPVAVQAKRAPATPLVDDLLDARLTVAEWDGVEGTARFYDHVRAAVGDGESGVPLAHLKQPLLDVAAANAATRPVGDMWAWDRRKSPVDIAPLVACTGALWALNSFQPEHVPEPGLMVIDV